MTARKGFATQVSAKILSAVRRLAETESRQLQSLVEEALRDLLEKHRLGNPRRRVMAAYQRSHEKFGSLYKKLAQ